MALWYDCGQGFTRVSWARWDLGCDAYLCCPGPSLANVDDRILHGPGRMIFAVNSAYPKIRPDVWTGLDRISCHDERLWREPFAKVLRLIPGDTDAVRYSPNVFYADMWRIDGVAMFGLRMHDVKFVWDKSTLTFALHLMVWMGARRIHLVGCDLGGARDYYDDRVLTPDQRKYNRELYAQQVKRLRNINECALRSKIEIISCTPGSPINDFLPYKDLRQALATSESCIRPVDVSPIRHALEAEKLATTVN